MRSPEGQDSDRPAPDQAGTPVALTIAGSDSSGGAGVQADLKTFAALEVYGTCAITAITAQNTERITEIYPLPAEVVVAQIEAVAGDFTIGAVKTGMLGTASIVEAVGAAIEDLDLPCLVVDPVMQAKGGDRLLAEGGVAALGELLRRAAVVTPNIPEAEALTGMHISNIAEAKEAAIEIRRRYHPEVVVITGGHLEGDAVVDVVFDGIECSELSGARVQTRHTHGTGCTFASAIAAYLARGRTRLEAISLAKAYVAACLRHAPGLGRGHGPLGHFPL